MAKQVSSWYWFTFRIYRLVKSVLSRLCLLRQPIRNLSSLKPTSPRFCDIIVYGKSVILEVKTEKNKYETISWEDMQYQVNIVKKRAVEEQHIN